MSPSSKKSVNPMPWQPALTGKDLWGPEMAATLAGAHAERLDLEREQHAHTAELAERAGKRKPDDRKSAEALQKLVEKTPEELAPPDSDPALMPHAAVAVSHSCVTGFGPFNAWAHNDGGPVRAPTASESSSPRNIHARVVAVEGSFDLTVGSGCWFRVDHTGVAQLAIQFTHNSHNNLWPGLGGFTTGSIAFAGSVFGASEGGFVDRGGFLTVFSSRSFANFESFSAASTSMSGPFDVIAGGLYYCAGRVIVRASSFGVFCVANVEANAIMNPLVVCGP